MKAHVLDPNNIKDLRPYVIGPDGRLRVMPASFYENTTVPERAMLGNRTGAYVLPTNELIVCLRELIHGRRAIEIGSGNGVIADALGIVGTDNKMQSWPHIRGAYESLGQTTIKYGPNVVQMAAVEAVRHYHPDVVIACWVTHKYDRSRHSAGGNVYGVVEESVIRKCKQYIFVGNREVHKDKSIWSLPHKIITAPWLYSRAVNMSGEFIAVFGEGVI